MQPPDVFLTRRNAPILSRALMEPARVPVLVRSDPRGRAAFCRRFYLPRGLLWQGQP